jgi:hypothetical protein
MRRIAGRQAALVERGDGCNDRRGDCTDDVVDRLLDPAG